MASQYLSWRHFQYKIIQLVSLKDEIKHEMVDFLHNQCHSYTPNTKAYDYVFVSKRIKEHITVSGFDTPHCSRNINDGEWLVVCTNIHDRTPINTAAGIFNLRMNKDQIEIERRLFIELVSVPAGRFKGLLSDGGVEYQRQMARFSDLELKTN